jgi:RNA polymerase sigma-70 factor, ECF subfamily
VTDSRRQDDFARLFIEHQGRLYGYIATMLPNRDDAEDILQRTSLILWQKWAQYDPNQAFLPWARAIALNEIRNFLRRSERANVHLSEAIVSQLADQWDDEASADRSEALARCLERLPALQRDLLEQCYLGSVGVKAIAESVGMTAAALYMRLHRIRITLVDCIEKRMAAT